ncbi:MAG: hydrogenase expression/formation protein HypE [Verrucomicrobia bacterium]|nr:hydrogenase expression/formation protein HypE [Verrucomicrobiota bacterium]
MNGEPAHERIAEFSCPIPISDHPNILLAHGGGGQLTHSLIEKMFAPAFRNSLLESRHDGAVLSFNGIRLAFTTDSHVVHPLFFPGGDIGTLAVNGTVNDLAMCGARPVYLSAGFIIEEGMPMETLWRVVQSMRCAAARDGVQLVTGDTKVVEKGKGDGLFINTSGIGILEHNLSIAPASVRDGDVILLSGDIGRHGIAIMAVREGLSFESAIQSDCASVAGPVMELLKTGIEIHCLRDLTRGGLATALVEITEVARLQADLEETAIPVREEVRGACELLGLDPLYVANEGRFVALVPSKDALQALTLMKSHSGDACVIGRVIAPQSRSFESGVVTIRSPIGASRIVDRLSGEQLPRIC